MMLDFIEVDESLIFSPSLWKVLLCTILLQVNQ